MEIRKPTLIIGFLMFLGSLLMLVKPTNHEEPVLSHLTVPNDVWKEIQVSLNDFPLHNEDFLVEVNSQGIIKAVHAEQTAIVDLLLDRQAIPYLNAKGELKHYNAKLRYQDRYLKGLRFFELPVHDTILCLINIFLPVQLHAVQLQRTHLAIALQSFSAAPDLQHATII